jgi:predicted acylesterase/phospholipase RssA
MKTAIAYSGAGANIIIEVGFAKAFKDMGLTYDFINGTSSGAIVSAFVHAGQLDVLEHIALTATDKDIFTHAPWDLLSKSRLCFLDNAPLRKLLTRNLNCAAVRAAGKSCVVNITDLKTWTIKQYELTRLDNADMIEAIVISTSLPIAFAQSNGLVDGGVLRTYPLYDGLASRADRVIIFIPTKAAPFRPRNLKQMIEVYLLATVNNQLQSLQLALEYLSSKAEIIVVQVKKPTGIGLLNFDALGNAGQRQSYIELGYEIAKDALAGIPV